MRRIGLGRHFFCGDAACDVVYFDDAGAIYRTMDVRMPVWQKEPAGDRMICYCFDENETNIRAEVEASGTSQAATRVRAHIAARRCACELRNPQGVCCLGDLTMAVDRVRRLLEIGAPLR